MSYYITDHPIDWGFDESDIVLNLHTFSVCGLGR